MFPLLASAADMSKGAYGLMCFALGMLVALAGRALVRLAVLLVLVAGQCAPQPAFAAEPPLEQLGRILELSPPPEAKALSCHGTPVGITQVLTAAHCVGPGVLRFAGQQRRDGHIG